MDTLRNTLLAALVWILAPALLWYLSYVVLALVFWIFEMPWYVMIGAYLVLLEGAYVSAILVGGRLGKLLILIDETRFQTNTTIWMVINVLGIFVWSIVEIRDRVKPCYDNYREWLCAGAFIFAGVALLSVHTALKTTSGVNRVK